MFSLLLAPLLLGAPITLSLDVRQAQLPSVLRLIAEVADKDLVVAQGIQGRVTLRLRQVGWKAALDVVTQSQGLAYELRGPIIFVDTAEAFLNRARQAAELKQLPSTGPPRTRVLPVSYARAADLAPLVRNILGKSASVVVDERTNSLVITVR